EGPDSSAAESANPTLGWWVVLSASAFKPSRSYLASHTERKYDLSSWRAAPDDADDPLVDLLDRSRRIDGDDAVGGDRRDLLVGLGDGALQLDALGLEAVLALGAAEADLRID